MDRFVLVHTSLVSVHKNCWQYVLSREREKEKKMMNQRLYIAIAT